MKHSHPATNPVTRPSLLALALLASPPAVGQMTETEAALLHSSLSSQGQFGSDVDVVGPWAIVGDLAHDGVFFYRRWDDGWRLAQVDRGPHFADFGQVLSTDGKTLVVGGRAYGFPQNAVGYARIYELIGDRWTISQELHPPGFLVQNLHSIFGVDVAVDGEVMVIGASGYDVPIDKAGMILIYERIGSDWCRVAEFGQETLTGPSPGEHNSLGSSVAVSGNTIAAAAPGKEGCVYVFERQATGTWKRTAMLWEVNPPDDGNGFGGGLALSEDERLLVVGQPRPDSTTVPFGFLPGRAHVFEKSQQGNWTRTAVLHASDEFIGTNDSTAFGGDIAIEGDRIVIGSAHAKGNPAILGNSGAVYFFERQPNGTWPPTEAWRWFSEEGQNADFVGEVVAIDRGFVIGGSRGFPAHVFEVGVGTVLCTSSPNSTSERGRLTAVAALAEEMLFTLSARDCPADRPGIFLASLETGQSVLGNGVLCLGRPIERLQQLSPTGSTGTAFYTLDVAGLAPGTTLHLQYWFSDPVGAGSNLTGAVSVMVE